MLVVAALSLAPFATPPQGTATVHYLEWTAQVTQTTSAAPAPFDTLVVGDGLLATIEVIFDVAWDPLANGGRGYHSSHGISTIDIGALSFTADPSTPNPAISIWETITPATDNITYVSRLVSSAGLVTATFEFSDSQGDAFVGPEINEIPFPFFPQTQSDQTCTATFRDSSGAVFLQAEVSELRSIHICSQACLATANSTRTCASTFVEGSRFVVDNDVTLRVVNLPTNAFGFFITSLTPGFTVNPAGSEGNLCLGGAIGRFSAPGQILDSGAMGTFSLRVDLTGFPAPAGPVAVAPGERWFFQAWHRDSSGGAATSNFSGLNAQSFR